MKRSPLVVILFVAFVDLVGYGLIIPLQASYADRLGASGFTFGLLVGVYAAMQFIFNPILGRLSDRIGRRPVLLLSIAGSVASHVLLGVADLMNSLPLLFAARILDGVTGANVATAQAYIADVTADEDRAKGMGLFGAAFGLGFVIGPAIGAALAAIGSLISGARYGTSWPAFGASAISITALVLVWRFLPESRPRGIISEPVMPKLTPARLRAAFRHPRLRELYLIVVWVTFSLVLLEVSFVYLCRHRFGLAETGTGLMFAYMGVIIVTVQGGLVGRLAKHFGEARILSIGPFFTSAGFAMLAAVSAVSVGAGAWGLLFGGCLVTLVGHGLTGPNLNALVSRQAKRDKQGATFGLSQGLASLSRAVAPPVGGWLYDVRPWLPYVTGAVLLLGVAMFASSIRAAQEAALRSDADRPA